MFMHPGTTAIFLREKTWMSDVAITNWLRNYAESGDSFIVKDRKVGVNSHYALWPVPGGWHVMPWKLPRRDSTGRTILPIPGAWQPEDTQRNAA